MQNTSNTQQGPFCTFDEKPCTVCTQVLLGWRLQGRCAAGGRGAGLQAAELEAAGLQHCRAAVLEAAGLQAARLLQGTDRKVGIPPFKAEQGGSTCQTAAAARLLRGVAHL